MYWARQPPGPSASNTGAAPVGRSTTKCISTVRFHLRLSVNPQKTTTGRQRDEFRLFDTRINYEQRRTIRDDKVAGNHWIDLVFDDVPRDSILSLEWSDGDPAGKLSPHLVFTDVPVEDLL